MAGGNIDLRGCLDEKQQLFQHDIPAFYAQKINGLTIEDLKLKWTSTRMPYFTNGIEVHNFSNLRINNFNGTASPINAKAFAVYLWDGKKAAVDTKISVKKINVTD